MHVVDSKPGMRLPPWLVDEFLESYLSWREQCEQLRTAYERWARSEPSDRSSAFVAYRAALDQEECAAALNRGWTERLRAEAGSRRS
jgi:hypothetical protein